MRIIFMGSPIEVLAPLEGLVEGGRRFGAELVAIVSQPARPSGRGGRMQDPPVAKYGKERNIPTLQPESAKSSEFIQELYRLKPDVVVTAAYGQILSDEFLKIPTIGTINIHPSLLPAYRGATPVPAALLDGCVVTGVTILFTVKQLDAGNIILQKEFSILDGETAGVLTQRLFAESSSMLLEALERLGKNPATKGDAQDPSKVTFCKKISKEMGQIEWSQSADTIFNRFRAFHPWPGSSTNFGDRTITVTEMSITDAKESPAQPGCMQFDKVAKAIIVSCGAGSVRIHKLKPSGGKEMDAAAFWNGIRNRDFLTLGTPT